MAFPLQARRTALSLTALGLTAALVLGACEPLGEGSPGAGATDGDGDATRLTVATGGTGGVYIILGGGLADVLSDNIEGVQATAQETSASVDNMLLIGSGDADVAFVLGDTAADAVEGRTDDFEDNPVDACALAILYNNYTQLVTTADSGIETIGDLQGKRVSLGAPGSGTEIIALRILEAAGVDPDADIERSGLLVDETVEALRDGTVDAGFWSGGLPTGALSDFATTGDLKLIPTGEFAAPMEEQYGPFYTELDIPADTYQGQTEAVPTVIVPNVLVVGTSMSEDLQRQITEVLFEQKDALVEVHPAANELDPSTAGDIPFMDVCPGAQAYYDEAG